MIKSLKRKLNDKKGVTIIMAMFVMLVSVMVISVVLSAANTSAKTINYDKTQQQAFLTVSSAADYVGEEISKFAFERTKEGYGGAWSYSYDKSTSTLEPLMQTLFNYREEGKSTPISFVLDVNVPDGVEDALETDAENAIQPVYVTVQMDKEYDVFTRFELKDNGVVSYRMTVYSEGSKREVKTIKNIPETETTSASSIEVYTEIYSWTKGVVERGFGSSHND